MRFLTGGPLQKAISDILQEQSFKCAVAFWGTGANELLPKGGKNAYRIVCNLRAGGTNPFVIDNIPREAVKQNDRLHAKVYIGRDRAIISSANVSANGLGLEGSEQTSWIEAGIEISTSDFLREWFENLWNHPDTRKVSDGDIMAAKIAWKKRQAGKPPLADPRDLEVGIPTFPLLWWHGIGESFVNRKAIQGRTKAARVKFEDRVMDGIEIEGPMDRAALNPGRWVLIWVQDDDGKPNMQSSLRWMQVGPIHKECWRPNKDRGEFRDVALPNEQDGSAPFLCDTPELTKVFRKLIERDRFDVLRKGPGKEGYFTKLRLSRMQEFWAMWRMELNSPKSRTEKPLGI